MTRPKRRDVELSGKLLEALEDEHKRREEDPNYLREDSFAEFVRGLLREALGA